MAEKIALSVDIETGKAVSNLGQLEKATKKLNKTVDQTEKETQTLQQQFDSLNKEIKESPVNIRAMNKQIQKYQAIALEAGRTTPLGKQAIQKAAALKDRYIDIQNEVNRLANDGVKLQAALDIGTTIVAGFTAFQGVMALSGVESEELRETMVKLQGAQSVLMGVEVLRKNLEKESTIVLVAKNTAEKANLMLIKATTVAQKLLGFSTDTTTKSFKLMRGALIATGIGALIVGIGLLIANWDKLSSAISGTTEAQKINNQVTDKAIENISSELSAADKLKKVLNDETISREEKNKAVKELQKTYPDLLSNVNAEKDSLEDINKALELNTKLLLLKSQQEAIAEIRAENMVEITKATIKAQTGANISLSNRAAALVTSATAQQHANIQTAIGLAEVLKQNAALDDLDNKLQERINTLKAEGATINENSEAIKKVAAERKKAAAERKKASEDAVKAQEDAAKKEIAIEKTKQDKLDALKAQAIKTEADNNAALMLQLEALDEAYRIRKFTDAELEIEAINNKYFALTEATFLGEEELKRIKLQQANEILEAEKRHADKSLEIEKKKNDDKGEDGLELAKAGLQLSLDTVNALMSINNAADAQTDAQKRKQFERNKKLSIAGATISAAQGVVNIWSAPSTIPQPYEAIYKAVQTALLIGTTAANISKIKNQKFQGGGGGAMAPISSPTAGGAGDAPSIEPITNTSTLTPQEPQQVFVTETDITSTQNQVSVIETQATLQ